MKNHSASSRCIAEERCWARECVGLTLIRLVYKIYTTRQAEAEMERIQILLEPVERQALKQLADEANTSMSNIVRGLLRERLKERRRAKLRQAAQLMADEYRSDPDLTAFSVLDGEEFLDAPR